MNYLVIPSIREKSLKEFLNVWEDKGDWDEIILIEDNTSKTFEVESKWRIHHYSHKEISEELGDNSWIISRKDSACRTFGFKKAWDFGAEWILSLDDDTFPDSSLCKGICAEHLEVINSFTVCKCSVGKRSRGLPYRNLGKINNIVCNMGLWTNIGDWDSVQSLADDNLSNYFTPPIDSFLAHPQHRYPFCGMNIFFKRSVIPAMYFPLMGDDYKFYRQDDIWAGWIFQKIFEHLRLCWSIGKPWIEHRRASDPFVNLIKESTGIKKNEYFWQRINDIRLFGNTVVDCVLEIGNDLSADEDGYISILGKAIKIWIGLFSERKKLLSV
jgi:hypothetical protein